jgi:hypothetical protein
VSLLSGCNLGLQPRGVEPLPSSTGAESSASAGVNTWLEWPTSSFDPVSPDNQPTPRRQWCQGIKHPYNCDSGSKKSTPFDFYPVNSENVVTDHGTGTDTTISSGSLTINVPIRRFVGYKPYQQKSLNNNTLSQKATIQLSVFTPDSTPSGCIGIDMWSINGYPLPAIPRAIKDSNVNWHLIEATIPIQSINFPLYPGVSADNLIQIDANINNCVGWDIEVDWAKISFGAGPVVVFVHGINAEGSDWNKFNNYLMSSGIVSENSITLSYAPFDKSALRRPDMCTYAQFTSTKINALGIVDKSAKIAELYGTGELVLVGHSKGGMDSKLAIGIASSSKSKIEVGTTGSEKVTETLAFKNLVTINTPHLGTPAADLGILKTLEENKLSNKGEFDTILGPPKGSLGGSIQIFAQQQVLGALLSGNFVCDLTTDKATKFDKNNPPYSYGKNIFGTNTDAALAPPYLSIVDVRNFKKVTSIAALDVFQRLYEYVGKTQMLKFTIDPKTGLYTAGKPIPKNFESNDILVSRTSAAGSGIPFVADQDRGIHHTAVIDDDFIQEKITLAAIKGTNGVDWTAR